jgi:hypothetical protein
MQEQHLARSAYLAALAQRSGCRDFNEMWDHLFEANFLSRPTRSFIEEVATYCFFGRVDSSQTGLDADGTSAREQAMAAAIEEQIAGGSSGGGPILVVTGGFHSVALPELVAKGLRRAGAGRVSPESVQQALIRYSFQQLDAPERLCGGDAIAQLLPPALAQRFLTESQPPIPALPCLFWWKSER